MFNPSDNLLGEVANVALYLLAWQMGRKSHT